MNAIDLLIAQHRSLESKFEDLLAATDNGGSAGRRQALLAEAGDDLAVHIASEELVFYPAVKARRTEDILLESLEEHLSLKRLLSDLMALPATAETFRPKAKVLQEQTEHHHKEEENHLFPKVRTLLDEAELERLGEEMLRLQTQLRAEGDPRTNVPAEQDAAAPLP